MPFRAHHVQTVSRDKPGVKSRDHGLHILHRSEDADIYDWQHGFIAAGKSWNYAIRHCTMATFVPLSIDWRQPDSYLR